MTPADGPNGTPDHLELSLLGEFSLRHADPRSPRDLAVSAAGQRLLAMLALRQRPVRRSWVAESLWADSDERHASWNLRSTLHRLPSAGGCSPVATVRDNLVLADSVRVDFVELVRRPLSFGGGEAESPAHDHESSDNETLSHIAALEHDVLPDWYEEWVIVERERHRQLRLHALETLSRRLAAARRFGLAVHAGLAAVQGEPLRESAHRAVIEAHLGEGNLSEAVRQFRTLATYLMDELAITPSRELADLVFGAEREQGRRPRRRTA